MHTVDYIALEVPGLARQFVERNAHQPAAALDCGDFSVWQGEIFGILGASGSGRSALVRSIADRLVADSGRVTVSGHNVLRDGMAVKRLINRVLADAVLFYRLTPMQVLIYGARLYGLGEQAARGCAWEVLKTLGLDEKAIFCPLKELAVDVQQKVVGACASLTQPALLLLNEPTWGLPTPGKREAQSLIEELRDVYNATILLTTRDVREAESLCDRVAIFDGGQIVALDTPSGLKGLVSRANGRAPTLEDVFAQLTGKQLVQ
jgi:ABC-2 type transport system ATP-binding protein